MDIVAQGKLLPTWNESLSILTTFSLTVFAWIFFRAENVDQAIGYISKIFSRSLFSIPYLKDGMLASSIAILIFIFLMIEWLGRENQYAIQHIGKQNKIIRWGFYYLAIVLIFVFAGAKQQFIYFQF